MFMQFILFLNLFINLVQNHQTSAMVRNIISYTVCGYSVKKNVKQNSSITKKIVMKYQLYKCSVGKAQVRSVLQ